MNSNATLQPTTIDEVREALLASEHAVIVGNQTKPPLSSAGPLSSSGTSCNTISVHGLSGVVQYEPSEFTFTAYAGTKVADVQAVLSERGQYLPFDPMLVRAGATLGGTIAAGLSGPGRFRYGSIRDFFLGAKLILGDGTIVNVGGKVVKNAAGFDIPKFLVGSCGQYGGMIEVTFKVFPKPVDSATLRLPCESAEVALQKMASAAVSRWELDAIDYHHATSTIYFRQRGPREASSAIASEMQTQFPELEQLDADTANTFWSSITELDWSAEATHVVKIPTTPRQFPELCQAIAAAVPGTLHVSGCGSVVWAAMKDADSLVALESVLTQLGHRGLCVRGNSDHVYLNRQSTADIEVAVQQAFDPDGRLKRRFGSQSRHSISN
ncbi:FAD linked oxidase domain-containing protein [Rhodopirellula maiorica SM1]|uniref:FAD linked oxidase domain-containing protein n=1 Tax=Rhodopirellula maiorica SM1 TaxID=1265738 RepID=M5RMY0_9BACT|nr:FAD-binding protein [Rhodopirellula maiorica]EMI20683.1 FAD linked oxidase domain-containing protein [Rhodopirellula maiorica SM1]